MNSIFFTRRQFQKLQKCKLQKNIIHTEAELYVIEKNDSWKKQKMLLKYFYINEGEYFSNKLFTINNLINNRDFINLPALVLPTELAVVNGQVVGYIMPFIENCNLITLLKDLKVSTEKKKNYLAQIGTIINDVHNRNNDDIELYLGDIHEANFIVGTNDDKVYAIDSDSYKIGRNLPFASKYLSTNPNISSLKHKYPMDKYGINIPNKNSDLMCYIFTIINTIAREEMQKKTSEEYYTYLTYLSSLGFGDDFINACGRIYTNADNISPLPYFDQIPDNIYRASYLVFKHQKEYQTPKAK